jgi:hypothetical protein
MKSCGPQLYEDDFSSNSKGLSYWGGVSHRQIKEGIAKSTYWPPLKQNLRCGQKFEGLLP